MILAFVVAAFAFLTALFAAALARWALAIAVLRIALRLAVALLEIPLLAFLRRAFAAVALAWRTGLGPIFTIRRRRDPWRKWSGWKRFRRMRFCRLTAHNWTTAWDPPEAARLFS